MLRHILPLLKPAAIVMAGLLIAVPVAHSVNLARQAGPYIVLYTDGSWRYADQITPTPEVVTTPTLMPTSTPTPMPGCWIVSMVAVNVRSGPGIAFPVLGVAPVNTRTLAEGQSTDGVWLKIWWSPKNSAGWTSRVYWKLGSGCGDLPTLPFL